MRIEINEELLTKAKELSGIESDKEVIERALELLILVTETASENTKLLLGLDNAD